MICRECSCMRMGWIKSKPETPYCIGVKHPFEIKDVDAPCTEYLDNNMETIPSFGNVMTPVESYYPPILTILVGLPGVGKSTYAKYLVETQTNTVWISSDAIRERLYGDGSCQKDPSKVFEIMQEETINALNNGFSVVYDATSITRKSRANILGKVPKHVVKHCTVVWAPLDVCYSRDALRDRTVGPEVIEKMLRRFEAPFYDEGFEYIKVHISDVYYNKEHYYTGLISAMDIPHDNPHHSEGVLEHCRQCGIAIIDNGSALLVQAGFLHDIGKPLTKTFKNRKGEDVDTAHYYDHQSVGAWLSYGIEGHNPTLAWLISTHMAPFINLKYYNSLPPIYKKWIDVLHNADRGAH